MSFSDSDESWDDGLTAALLSVDDPRPHVDIDELLCELLRDPQSQSPKEPNREPNREPKAKQSAKQTAKQTPKQTPKPKAAKPKAPKRAAKRAAKRERESKAKANANGEPLQKKLKMECDWADVKRVLAELSVVINALV